MIIGVGKIGFRLALCHSLKDKRKIMKSILARTRNAFNLTIAEVGCNDMHHRAEIGFALVGNDSRLLNSKIDKVFEFIENLHLAEIIETDMEIIHL